MRNILAKLQYGIVLTNKILYLRNYMKKKKNSYVARNKYLPMFMVCPRVTTEKMTEQTVPIGLNIDTSTGPLFSSAQQLTLRHIPLTTPACALQFSKMLLLQ